MTTTETPTWVYEKGDELWWLELRDLVRERGPLTAEQLSDLTGRPVERVRRGLMFFESCILMAGVAGGVFELTPPPPPLPPGSPPAAAWRNRSPELTGWARAREFVRTDRFGSYYKHRGTGETRKSARPNDAVPAKLTPAIVMEHFGATRTDHVIGAFYLTPDAEKSVGRKASVDIDSHEAEDKAATEERNERYAYHLYEKTTALGFRPLLATWGGGSYHLHVYFERDIPGADLDAFGAWLVKDAAEHEFTKPIEHFPKQAEVPKGKFGNWLRLVGRHHTRDEWAKVFNGEQWLEGEDAVGYVLSIVGDDPALIPPEAKPKPEPPRRPKPPSNDGPSPNGSKRWTGTEKVDVFKEFNRRSTLDEVCRWHEEAGHTVTSRKQGRVEFTRAGKEGKSQSFNVHCVDEDVPVTWNFSSNAGLPENKPMSPAQVWCFYKYGRCDTITMKQFAAELRQDAGKKDGGAAGGMGDESEAPEDESAEPPGEPSARSPRPRIELTADLHLTVDGVHTALAERDAGLFQRAGKLVYISRDVEPPVWLKRDGNPPVITRVTDHHLVTRISRVCELFVMKENRNGNIEPVQKPPTVELASIVGHTPCLGVRPITGIVLAPTLRPDGSLIEAHGYDTATGLFFDSTDAPKLELLDRPSRDDALAAVEIIRDLLIDFPFQAPEHFSSALAALLTIIARHAVKGCTPVFPVRANRAGTGKGLLIDVLVTIALGTPPAAMANTVDDNEARKRLLAIALSADAVIKIDNVGEADGLGTPVLDMAVTTGKVKDRLLGKSEDATATIKSVWFASGNAMTYNGDMHRRVCEIALLTLLDDPEQRLNLTHPRIVQHVQDERAVYLAAALTIMRAWFTAGCPTTDIPNWGSFEAWSDVIRQPIVWLDLPDPWKTRAQVKEKGDPKGLALAVLVENWDFLDATKRGVTSTEIVNQLDRKDLYGEDSKATQTALAAAFSELMPWGSDSKINSKTIGKALAAVEKKTHKGRWVEAKRNNKGINVWRVKDATASPEGQGTNASDFG